MKTCADSKAGFRFGQLWARDGHLRAFCGWSWFWGMSLEWKATSLAFVNLLSPESGSDMFLTIRVIEIRTINLSNGSALQNSCRFLVFLAARALSAGAVQGHAAVPRGGPALHAAGPGVPLFPDGGPRAEVRAPAELLGRAGR